LTIDPKETATGKFHSFMLGAIAPRPIAFASTLDGQNNINLSPFSFFNAFGSNPPILIFSPARRVRDNTTKHTLENALETKEVVINICNYSMAEQMSLSSTEYPKGVNEFEKSGFTMLDSTRVAPPRVKESPASFECRVNDVIAMGSEGGAGNLIICEVLLAHISRSILDSKDEIDPVKLDAIGRMGGNWYSRANASSIFEISKPLTTLGIGVDSIPKHIRLSTILSGNDLGKLGNVEHIPSDNDVKLFSESKMMVEVKEKCIEDDVRLKTALHQLAKDQLVSNHVDLAWKILLQVSQTK